MLKDSTAGADSSGASALDNFETGAVGGAAAAAPPLTFQGYDEIYPPGPGKEVAEQVCMVCHGENFFPTTRRARRFGTPGSITCRVRTS